MANVNAITKFFNCPNYVGELFLIGMNMTPFLNRIGGLEGTNAKLAKSWQFPTAVPWALEAAAQPAITEDTSLTAPTPWTYVRGQDTNVCQIFHKAVDITYAKKSDWSTLTGLANLGDPNAVTDELSFQKMANLKQIAIDAEYSFLNGAYNLAAASNQANKTRGIITAMTTNTEAGGAAQLTTTMVDNLLRTMATNGAVFGNVYAFCGAYQKQKLTKIYGYEPESRNEAGLNITSIETDFCMLNVVWAPQVPAATLPIIDISVVSPVFLPVPDKGLLFYEELSKTGADDKGQIYGQMGIDYGPEEYHGKITALATAP